MDNMPAWEYGALEMVRDLALSMRKDFSRSQSQSTEHEALKKHSHNLILVLKHGHGQVLRANIKRVLITY